MNLPKEIKVGDSYFRVKPARRLVFANKEVTGLMHGGKKLIEIIHPHPLSKNALLHELLHCIEEFMDMNLEETVVEKLTNGIRMLFIDNPNLLEIFLEEERSGIRVKKDKKSS